MRTFHLTIASLGETRFDGDAEVLIVPGEAGEMAVYAHHQPLVTPLKAGTLVVKRAGGEERFLSEGGILEVSNNKAVVLL
jgi:F-type H+-transporting ATPase subunit epsilon